MEIKDKIVSYLEKFPNSSAKQISRDVGCDKSEVNSILYSHKNTLFKLHETSPPTWTILRQSVEKIKLNSTQFTTLKTSEELHVDFQGGDWKVIIQVTESSRNDPVVHLERTGPRAALIQVSSSVVNNMELDSKFHPDVVMALASSALAWEIAMQSDAVLEEKFNFETALKDIYLSLSVAGKPKGL